LEDNRAAQRQRVQGTDTADEDVLDALLEKLRRGDAIGRRSRRTRGSGDLGGAPSVDEKDNPADIARDMLGQLQSAGFIAAGPSSPTGARGTSRRRRRRRTEEEAGSAGNSI
jgi:cytokinesis protein